MNYDEKPRDWLLMEIARLRRMLTSDVEERIISELAALATELVVLGNLDPEFSIDVRISQQELADRIGSCRETVNRKLQKMRNFGLVTISRYQQIVVSPRMMKMATKTKRDVTE